MPRRGPSIRQYKRADGTKAWCFRKWITLLDGTKHRIQGRPYKTYVEAETAERNEIEKWLHPEKAIARAQAAEALNAPKESKDGAPLFRTYGPSVIAIYRPKGKREGSPRSDYSRSTDIRGPLMRAFGHMPMDQIDQAAIDYAIKHQWKGLKDQTINNRLSSLSCVLRYYYKSIKRARPELDLKVRTRGADIKEHDSEDDEIDCEAVDPADVDKLLAAATKYHDRLPRWIRAGVLLAADAGLRNGELRAFRWTDINENKGERNSLTVRKSLSSHEQWGPPKNGKSREIPLSTRLATELKKLPRLGLTVLARESKKFGGMPLRYKPSLNAIKLLYKLAGVKMPKAKKGDEDSDDRPWHGLRHTYGTQIHAAGASDQKIMELMGHKDIRTSMIYVNPSERDTKRDNAALIAKAFG